jgi:hypothetical protein
LVKKKKAEDKPMESVLDTLELEVPKDAIEAIDEASILGAQIEVAEEVQEEIIPDITDLTWHDYVMGQFGSDEMKEGNPTTDGLRRVAQKLLGRITDSNTEIAEAASLNNGGRASIVVSISFFNGETYSRFSGAADSAPDNTDDVFRRYPTAIAESRAEGRALRKALNLRKVVAAEELSLTARTDTSGGGFLKIDNAQIKGIDIMCKRLNVDVLKFINSGTKKYNDINEVEFETGIKMMQELNRYQADSNNVDAKQVPDAIKGYIDTWNLKE